MLDFDKATYNAGNLFVVSGPSGAGKTVICKMVESQVSRLKQSVSATTRPIRGGENNGVDYYFLSRKDFEEGINNGNFIEWANIYGNIYGTPKSNIEKAKEEKSDLILEIDVQGARQIRNNFSRAVFIFVLPPSYSILEQRLRSRKSDNEESIEKRLKQAFKEVEELPLYDYLIVNDNIEEAVVFLKSIIYAYRCRIKK